jgi:AsmA family protein
MRDEAGWRRYRLYGRFPSPRVRRLTRNRALAIILGLLGVVIALTIGAAVLLVTLDWRPYIERAASRSLGRPLSVASLRIAWRNPLVVELTDLRLANAPWGSQPDMLRVDRIAATIDLSSLLHGVLRYQTLLLEKPVLLLERDSGGVGNWHFTDNGAALGLAIIPKDRTQFPTLIDFTLRQGKLTYRATQSDLRLDFHDLAIRSAGDDQNVALTLDGAYNDFPTQLTATTDSYAVLRDASVPFGADVSMTSAASTIGFTGTMTEPLDFEGVRGKMQIDAKTLGSFLRIFGAEMRADFPFAVAGPFERTDGHWQISEAKGRLARNGFGGRLAVDEGGRGAVDTIAANLGFAELDLAPLIAGGGKSDAISLRLETDPAANVDARIVAKQLTYETRRLADFAIAARTKAGELSVSALSFALAGGKVEASGSARAIAGGSRVAVSAALSGADADRLAQTVDAEPGQIAGRLDGGLLLDITGATLTDALKTSRGQAVLSMTDGRVVRDLVERASTDLRTLFRKDERWMPVTCLLGIADLQDGVATISPLRLRTPDTTLVGFGHANLITKRVDLIVKPETGATSLLALKLPLRITGSFDKLTVAPSFDSAGTEPAVGDPCHSLKLELQLLAERNPCRH